MIFHEFGCENEKNLFMFHGSCMTWDMYLEAIKIISRKVHVIIPAITGHDLNIREDFTSIEEVVSEAENWLLEKGLQNIDCIYGLSMGGALTTRLLANQIIRVKYAIIDGGITPYQIPSLFTRLLALRDFMMLEAGRNIKQLLEIPFPSDKFQKEEKDAIYRVLRHYTVKSIWRVFESCNNYSMPKTIPPLSTRIEYWYGEMERKNRKLDIKYIKNIWPETIFKEIPSASHGEFSLKYQNYFAQSILDKI